MASATLKTHYVFGHECYAVVLALRCVVIGSLWVMRAYHERAALVLEASVITYGGAEASL